MPGKTRGGEEEIAEFLFDGLGVVERHGGAELSQLLLHLVEHRGGIGPVEAVAGGPLPDPNGGEEGRQTLGELIGERSGRLRGALGGFDAVPGAANLFGVARLSVREDVWMAAHEFADQRPGHVVEVEGPFFSADLRLEDDLQQQIAKLVPVALGIPRFDGFDDLVDLLDGVRQERMQILRPVPRAALWTAQLRHQRHEGVEGARVGFRWPWT